MEEVIGSIPIRSTNLLNQLQAISGKTSAPLAAWEQSVSDVSQGSADYLGSAWERSGK